MIFKISACMRVLCVPVLLAGVAMAQVQPPGPAAAPKAADGMQARLAHMQAEAVRNEQMLHGYQWIESATVTIKGNARPPKQFVCHYAPDGTLMKAPLGPPAAAPHMGGGPLRHMMAEKKMEEFEEETTQIRALTAMYLPMKPAHFKEALGTRRVDFERNGPSGNAVIIHDYAKPGDEFRLVLDQATQHLQRIEVKSYFGKPEDVFTASVDFAVLPDGTVYPGITILHAPSMKIDITTAQSSFSKPVY